MNSTEHNIIKIILLHPILYSTRLHSMKWNHRPTISTFSCSRLDSLDLYIEGNGRVYRKNHHLPRIIVWLNGRKRQVFYGKEATPKPISHHSFGNVGNKMRLFVYRMWMRKDFCYQCGLRAGFGYPNGTKRSVETVSTLNFY